MVQKKKWKAQQNFLRFTVKFRVQAINVSGRFLPERDYVTFGYLL